MVLALRITPENHAFLLHDVIRRTQNGADRE
jgi:hypothetical protein